MAHGDGSSCYLEEKQKQKGLSIRKQWNFIAMRIEEFLVLTLKSLQFQIASLHESTLFFLLIISFNFLFFTINLKFIYFKRIMNRQNDIKPRLGYVCFFVYIFWFLIFDFFTFEQDFVLFGFLLEREVWKCKKKSSNF